MSTCASTRGASGVRVACRCRVVCAQAAAVARARAIGGEEALRVGWLMRVPARLCSCVGRLEYPFVSIALFDLVRSSDTLRQRGTGEYRAGDPYTR